MYQQNQMINTQAGQAQALHLHLNEQDVANLVLSELKRTAREYTTAALEATHPAIRQMFASLSQKTLQDQAELFDVLSQLGGYGSIKMATQLEVQQELSQQIQKAEQLQAIVQQAVHGSFAGGAYQQPFGQQQPSFQPRSHRTPRCRAMRQARRITAACSRRRSPGNRTKARRHRPATVNRRQLRASARPFKRVTATAHLR